MALQRLSANQRPTGGASDQSGENCRRQMAEKWLIHATVHLNCVSLTEWFSSSVGFLNLFKWVSRLHLLHSSVTAKYWTFSPEIFHLAGPSKSIGSRPSTGVDFYSERHRERPFSLRFPCSPAHSRSPACQKHKKRIVINRWKDIFTFRVAARRKFFKNDTRCDGWRPEENVGCQIFNKSWWYFITIDS